MRALTIAFGLLAAAPFARAQENYTFQSGPPPDDGFFWPGSIFDGDCLYPFDGDYEGTTIFCNDINNPVMIGAPGQTTSNAASIAGDALWGNPRSGNPLGDPELFIDFCEFFDEGEDPIVEVLAVSFDLAWATSNFFESIDEVEISVDDYEGDSETFFVPLNQTFNYGAGGVGGSGIGREGRVTLTPSGDIENIASITIFFNTIAPSGGVVAEFAIDNMSVSLDGSTASLSEVFPVNFNGAPSGDRETNSLKGRGIFRFFQGVKNEGSQATTYTITWTGSDPAIFDPDPAAGVNVPIGPGETENFAAEWNLDTDTALSGTYSGNFLVENDNNSSDPDDTVTYRSVELHDPAILSDNTAEVINPATVDEVSISNAPNLGHPGATRASASVTAASFTDPRFTLSGIAVDDRLDAGEMFTGTVGFNASGVPAGTYTAQLRIGFEMTSPIRSFLNGDQPIPDRVWTVQFTVPAINQGVANVTTGQNFGTSGLDINSGTTGVTLLDGTSGSNQTVTASFDPSPPAAGGVKFVNEAFDLGFSIAATQHVIQIGYQDASVPLGFLEEELRIYTYDSGLPGWVEAIQLNSNAGTSPAGAAPFIGSYAEYLATTGRKQPRPRRP